MSDTSNPSDSLRCPVEPIQYTQELVNERLKELWAFKELAPLDVLALLCWRSVFELVPPGTRPSRMVDEIGRAQPRAVWAIAGLVSPDRNFLPARDRLVLPVTARFASSLNEWDERVFMRELPELEKLMREGREHTTAPRIRRVREVFLTWAVPGLDSLQVRAAMLRGAGLAGFRPWRQGEEGETELFNEIRNEIWLAGNHISMRLLYRRAEGNYELDFLAVRDELLRAGCHDNLKPIGRRGKIKERDAEGRIIGEKLVARRAVSLDARAPSGKGKLGDSIPARTSESLSEEKSKRLEEANAALEAESDREAAEVYCAWAEQDDLSLEAIADQKGVPLPRMRALQARLRRKFRSG